jgi:hypothetical protein
MFFHSLDSPLLPTNFVDVLNFLSVGRIDEVTVVGDWQGFYFYSIKIVTAGISDKLSPIGRKHRYIYIIVKPHQRHQQPSS